MTAIGVLETDFGTFRAPAWVADVPTRLHPKWDEDGEVIAVRDVDGDTPEGKAFWAWFDGVVLPRARAAFIENEDMDAGMFINTERPF